MRFLVLVLLVASANVSAFPMDPVRVGEHDWLQPVEFTGLNWSEIDSACPASSGGVCNGSLNGIDVSGWTWADSEGVIGLFNHFLAEFIPSAPPPALTGIYDSLWFGGDTTAMQLAQLFVYFTPTETRPIWGPYGGAVAGRTRDLWSGSGITNPTGYWRASSCLSTNTCRSYITPSLRASLQGYSGWGAWLYRTAEIPTPTTLVLFMLALTSLVCSRLKANPDLD